MKTGTVMTICLEMMVTHGRRYCCICHFLAAFFGIRGILSFFSFPPTSILLRGSSRWLASSYNLRYPNICTYTDGGAWWMGMDGLAIDAVSNGLLGQGKMRTDGFASVEERRQG